MAMGVYKAGEQHLAAHILNVMVFFSGLRLVKVAYPVVIYAAEGIFQHIKAGRARGYYIAVFQQSLHDVWFLPVFFDINIITAHL